MPVGLRFLLSDHCGGSGRSADEHPGRCRTGSEGHKGATELTSENPNPGAVSDPHPTSTGLLSWRGALLALVLGLLMSTVGPCPVQAASASPETVRIGAFLTGLSDLDPSNKSFSASFWLWSISNEEAGSPLDRLEFPNAIRIESPNAISEAVASEIWNQRKIVGSFRHGWDVRRFPFDQQLLRIELEEAENDSQSILFAADASNSGFDQDINLSGWRIRSTRFVSGTKTYRTTFGDPRLPPGSASSYAKVELQILLQRIDQTGFWKLTTGAFAASLIALASFGLRVDHPSALSPRFGLLAGSAFAAVISLRNSANELGAAGYTTLIDAVHFTVLLYIMVATSSGVIAWRRFQKHGDAAAIKRLEKRMAGISTSVFISLILVLVIGSAL